jgi:hypothetical protein
LNAWAQTAAPPGTASTNALPVRHALGSRFWLNVARETQKHPDLVKSLEPNAFVMPFLHVYPDITHAWDQPESNGYSFINVWGQQQPVVETHE